MLLYVVTEGGKLLNPSDLPELPASSLEAVAEITAPDGRPYQLAAASFTSLRRYKAAMYVYLSPWVSRPDTTAVLDAIQEALKTSHSDYSDIVLERGTQETVWHNGYVLLYC